MGDPLRPRAVTRPTRSAAAFPRPRSWRGLALAGMLLAGCVDSGGPLLSARDPSLQPPLVTLHTLASAPAGGDSIPSRLVQARDLMAALVWAQVNDTIYHQAVRVNREWPLRLDAPLASTPPPEALLNVSGNGRGRFGMALLFLFEDANGNGRYDRPRGNGDTSASGGDGLLGLAGETRIVYVSDSGALAWVRAHPPADVFLTVTDPSRLGVGFNLLAAVNVRDTVFRQYQIHYPGGGTGLSSSPPDSGEYEVLEYPRKICDGFAPEEWSRDVPLSFGTASEALAGLVTVAPERTERP